jgi:hypothetical protein
MQHHLDITLPHIRQDIESVHSSSVSCQISDKRVHHFVSSHINTFDQDQNTHTNHQPSSNNTTKPQTMTLNTPLFPPSLIPSSASTSLPQNYTLRPLQRTDYSKGFLTCLTDLTWIGEISQSAFEERYDWMASKGKEWYYCIVIDDGVRIVATATMIVERKL